MTDTTMSVARANALALLWLPVSAAVVLLPFLALRGPDGLARSIPQIPSVAVSLALMLAAVVVHELLHAVGFLVFGGAPRCAVRLGFQRRTLTPFASCDVPVTASAYRAAGLLPAAVLGGLPVVAAWATGSGTLLLWGWLMLALAGGDVAAVWAMRRVPGTAMVVDDASRVGCRVVEPPMPSDSYPRSPRE